MKRKLSPISAMKAIMLDEKEKAQHLCGYPKDIADETVLHTGFDGKKHEYCPYNETSKTYDQTRAPLGVNVFLGSLSQNGSQLGTQNVLDIGCGTGTFMRAIQ